MTKYYITKYALTSGVILVEGEKTSWDKVIRVKNTCYHRPDWHTSWDLAKIQIQKMKDAKIKSLIKQLDKLDKLNVDDLKPKEDQDINP